MGVMSEMAEKEVHYLRIANQADRVTVASILYNNGYSVQPVKRRKKKNQKSFEYLVKYWLEPQEVDDAEVPE